MSAIPLLLLFWGSLALLVSTYALFPLLLGLRALRPAPRPHTGGPLPSVGFVIVVHNEAACIGDKLSNLEALDYPRDRLQVVVASDGSDDATEAIVAAHTGAVAVTLLSLPRLGKNAALNAAVRSVSGDVLVFSDADSLLAPDALRQLVAPFADTAIGGVAGDYHYARTEAGGQGERAYWNLERIGKLLASRAGSVTSATGQIYAIRSELFEPVPDGVTDDFFVSTGAIAAGRRLWFEPNAVARGPVAETVEAEYRRKVRVIGRGFASVWARRQLLDPRATGFYALQLAVHKVLRRLMGVPLVALAVAAPLLWSLHPVYRLATLAQLVLHGLALAGWLGRRHRIGRLRLLALPLFLDLANLAGLLAFLDFLRGRRHLGWQPQREGHDPAAPLTSASAPGRDG